MQLKKNMKKHLTLLVAIIATVGLAAVSCCETHRTMRISIFSDHIVTISRQENISFAEAAARIEEIGFEGVDVRVSQKPEEIRTLDSLGFAHSCVITDIDFSKEDQKELEDRTLAFMDEYGYDRLMLVAGFIPKEGFSQTEMDAARHRIAAFAARGAGKGYKIMVEDYDHERSFTSNAARLDTLFSVSKDLGLVFDTGNFQFSGEDAMEQFEHFRDKIGHLHLKDRASSTDLRCVPAGTGCIPIVEIIQKLKEDNYTGWLTIEQFGSRNMLSDNETAYNIIRAAIDQPRKRPAPM